MPGGSGGRAPRRVLAQLTTSNRDDPLNAVRAGTGSVTLPLIAPRNVCEDPDAANVRKTSNPACWYRIGVAPNHSSLESPSTAHGPPESFPNAHRVYCSFAHSALACLRMGMSGSASFQSVRKSWYAARALVVSLCIA